MPDAVVYLPAPLLRAMALAIRYYDDLIFTDFFGSRASASIPCALLFSAMLYIGHDVRDAPAQYWRLLQFCEISFSSPAIATIRLPLMLAAFDRANVYAASLTLQDISLPSIFGRHY